MTKNILITILLLIAGTVLSGQQNSPVQVEIKYEWKFSEEGTGKWYPAKVPGTVHTDLLENKLIPDPYRGINEKDLQWIGEKNWTYETEFTADKEILKRKNIELDFKGLDTYADVYLNDVKILPADNYFREWKTDCTGIIKAGQNKLTVKFENVFDKNLPKYTNAPYRLQSFDNNDQSPVKINMYSRKPGFHFGWDWGPRLITCGIFRPVYIIAWDAVKLNDVQIIHEEVSKEKVKIKSVLEILSDDNQEARINASVDGKGFANSITSLKKGLNKIELNFEMKEPKLWWTNRLGEQYLYNFKYQVVTKPDRSDEKKYRVGIRSLEVVRAKDQDGTSFYFRLNGRPVFAKGANYIPQDNFQNRVTPERYRHMIKSAAEANMNILRVWGGGIYEDDMFYDLCDEYGILVWQEFGFACGMYPSDEKYLDNVRGEVIDNVKRIRNHASLALYCGNNENEISWFQWGWKQIYSSEIQDQYEAGYKKLFYQVIPDVLKEVDNTRYYHYSSPSGAGFGDFSYKNGDAHYWGVWHGKEPFETYSNNIARYMSEYGFQSYPEISTIRKFAAEGDLLLHSEVMLSHQRCMADERRDKEYGNRLIQTYLEKQFKQPKDFESYVYVSQVLQAEGVKTAIEAHRKNMPFCMGTMYWQIDDCWPVASWSSIDYYGNWKALHYTAKKEYAPVIVIHELINDSLIVSIVSDEPEDLHAVLKIRVLDFHGKEIFVRSVPVNVAPEMSGCYLRLAKKDLTGDFNIDQLVVTSELIKGNESLARNEFYFKEPKDLALEKPVIKLKSSRNAEGYTIELKSDRLVKSTYLFVQDGFFTDNYFDLVPGETKRIELKIPKPLSDPEKEISIRSLVDSY